MAWGHGLGVNSALPCVGSPLGSHHSALCVLSVAGMTVLEPCVLGDSMSCCVPKFRAMQIQVQSSPLLLLEGPLGERARVWRDRGDGEEARPGGSSSVRRGLGTATALHTARGRGGQAQCRLGVGDGPFSAANGSGSVSAQSSQIRGGPTRTPPPPGQSQS